MTLITPEELADLEAKARAATPGDWKLGKQGCDNGFVYAVHDQDEPTVAMHLYDADAAHIAANAPDVTLRLIATIRALTARAEAMEKERDELREALRPFADNWCESLMSDVSDDEIVTMKFDRVSSFTLMSGHLRRAARLLPAEPDHGEV